MPENLTCLQVQIQRRVSSCMRRWGIASSGIDCMFMPQGNGMSVALTMDREGHSFVVKSYFHPNMWFQAEGIAEMCRDMLLALRDSHDKILPRRNAG